MVVSSLERGSVHRAERNWTEPAGKGVNISRALAANSIATQAVLPVGGANGDELCRLLEAGGVAFIPVPISGAVRSNVSVVETDGTVTKLNESGPTLSPEEESDLIEATVAASSTGDWVAATGSLAPGMTDDFYARLAKRLGVSGVEVAIDTSGPALREALSGGPGLVKPNRHELSELVGRPLRTLGEVVEAAKEARRQGAGQVLVSLGPDGAVLIDDAEIIHGEVSVVELNNTVGAGDALLAGFLAGGARGGASLANALAWARAAVRSPLTLMSPLVEADQSAVLLHDTIQWERLLQDDEAATTSIESPKEDTDA